MRSYRNREKALTDEKNGNSSYRKILPQPRIMAFEQEESQVHDRSLNFLQSVLLQRFSNEGESTRGIVGSIPTPHSSLLELSIFWGRISVPGSTK